MSLDESAEKTPLAAKYLNKYRKIVGLDVIDQLVKEYADAEAVFPPLSAQFSETKQDELYKMIDSSNSLSAQQKAETIAGLWGLLDGAFPNVRVLSYMETVFGTEFVETIKRKTKEFTVTLEIGRDCKWADIIGQVFRVLEFDRAGTKIGPGDTVKAKSLTKPYGYLLVESPILNKPARLPIGHKTDFLLAASVFDDIRLRESLKHFDLLVTYVPKGKLPGGLGGISHALHYAITPPGTLVKYYEVGYDLHMRKPAPEKVVGPLVWDGEVKVRIIAEPE